jgi:hypothetical protein
MSLDFIEDLSLKLQVERNLLNDNLASFSIIQGNGHAIAYIDGSCISYIYPDQDINQKRYYSVCTSNGIYPDDAGDEIATFNSFSDARDYVTELMGTIMGPGENIVKIYKCTTTCNDCDEKHWNCDRKSTLRSELSGCPYEGGTETSFLEYPSGKGCYIHYYNEEVLRSRYKDEIETDYESDYENDDYADLEY